VKTTRVSPSFCPASTRIACRQRELSRISVLLSYLNRHAVPVLSSCPRSDSAGPGEKEFRRQIFDRCVDVMDLDRSNFFYSSAVPLRAVVLRRNKRRRARQVPDARFRNVFLRRSRAKIHASRGATQGNLSKRSSAVIAATDDELASFDLLFSQCGHQGRSRAPQVMRVSHWSVLFGTASGDAALAQTQRHRQSEGPDHGPSLYELPHPPYSENETGSWPSRVYEFVCSGAQLRGPGGFACLT